MNTLQLILPSEAPNLENIPEPGDDEFLVTWLGEYLVDSEGNLLIQID
jgi:hypothetical protein